MLAKRIAFVGIALLLLAGTLAACARPAAAPPLPSNVVLSAKVDSAPGLDGQPEALWNKANAVAIPVSGGANASATQVSLKSVYAGDSVYFLAQWARPYGKQSANALAKTD